MTSLRFLADENLNERLVRGLLRRAGDLDLLRVRDTPRIGQSDAEILEFAATERRVILTHDVRTMPAAALARAKLGHSMPGVIVVSDYR